MNNRMISPKEKYMYDPEYNNLVRTLESFIEQVRFTPSELREACILASNNYEMRHVREYSMPPGVEHAFETLDNFVSKKNRRQDNEKI